MTFTSNAKTVAATRKLAPIVAANVIAQIEGLDVNPKYDGYALVLSRLKKARSFLQNLGTVEKSCRLFHGIWRKLGAQLGF